MGGLLTDRREAESGLRPFRYRYLKADTAQRR